MISQEAGIFTGVLGNPDGDRKITIPKCFVPGRIRRENA